MKKAVITGASGGLGRVIASKLIQEGIMVVNLSRTSSNLPVTNIKTDLTNNKDITNAIKIINKNHRDADVLILCSGVMHWHNIGETPIKEVDGDFMVNVTGLIKLTDGIAPLIKKNKGDIVIIGSTSSFICYPRSSVYNSTKHAILGYIKSLQQEYKDEDVRIIGFHPGGFKSRFHIKAGSKLKQRELMDPDYLADLIIYALKLPRNMQVSEIIISRK
jgi:short-subunit dehydrogenase